MAKTGILLLNLGTPDHCDRRAVYRYLTEFLNDPRVIDLPAPLRFILTNFIIVPLRASKAAEAYAKIWTGTGSPLLTHSQDLTIALQQTLGQQYQVVLGMRYGKPSIEDALLALQGVTDLVIVPLFPQYSSAATGSALEKTMSLLAQQWNIPSVRIINDFYAAPGFIDAYCEVIKQSPAYQNVDTILFSYHGLPERHINKSECVAACDHVGACPMMNDKNAFCYRAQCYRTTELIANALQLEKQQYQVAFQSRLGRTPWIKPYTDLVLPELIQQGKTSLAVVCPSFVADCLETLEEVNIRLREQWLGLGGKVFHFIPCINSQPKWVEGLARMLVIPESAIGACPGSNDPFIHDVNN